MIYEHNEDYNEHIENYKSLINCLRGNVKFLYCRDHELSYQCENGFVFHVPVSDTEGATFLNEDKAMLFMKWIRKEWYANVHPSI